MRSLAVLVMSVCLLAASGVRRLERVRRHVRDCSTQLTAADALPATVATRRSTVPKPDLPQLAFTVVDRLVLTPVVPPVIAHAHHVASIGQLTRIVPRSSRGPPRG